MRTITIEVDVNDDGLTVDSVVADEDGRLSRTSRTASEEEIVADLEHIFVNHVFEAGAYTDLRVSVGPEWVDERPGPVFKNVDLVRDGARIEL